MNTFIFEGFYDNILTSFGWQHIQIGIPLQVEISKHIKHAKYVLEMEHSIKETQHLERPTYSLSNTNSLAQVIVYNPDKWKYVEFYFFKDYKDEYKQLGSIYEVLHISM